uniref:Phosphatidic acid phosphatase type 2/haloperoxidase domain-containing protein n=1 Tax=mine drainage metagenome TaxID=410659 RepID=E6QWR6_9ZZZZ
MQGSSITRRGRFVALHLTPLVAHVGANSFPSDHLAATGLAVMYLWPRSRALATAAFVVGSLLGAARVLAHLHWPLDIVVAFAIGIAGMLLGHFVVLRLFPKQMHQLT